MLKHYDPRDWYWLKDDGTLFSSAKPGTVTDADPGYVAFLAAGGFATLWPRDEAGAQSERALQEVLTPYGLSMDGTPLPEPTAAEKLAAFLAQNPDVVSLVQPSAGRD